MHFNLRQAVEAVLLASAEPVTAAELSKLLDVKSSEIEQILQEIAAEFSQNHGFVLRQTKSGWFIYSHPFYANLVQRRSEVAPVNLSVQALETLAIIAYKQPITRSQVADIRGCNSDAVIRTLISYGLVGSVDSAEEVAASLVTTSYFLDKMGLKDLGELEHKRPYLPDNADEIVQR
jgi:segregation and condensation protein B